MGDGRVEVRTLLGKGSGTAGRVHSRMLAITIGQGRRLRGEWRARSQMDTRWKGHGSQGRRRGEGGNLPERENGRVGGSSRRCQSEGSSAYLNRVEREWDGIRSIPQIWRRFSNAIEGRGNSSSRVVQQRGRRGAWMRNWFMDGNLWSTNGRAEI